MLHKTPVGTDPGDHHYPASGKRALLTGFVHATDQQPVEGASVLLLEQETGKYVACCLTDSDGRFWLGPIPGDTLYIMKVTQPRMDIRVLELSV